MDSTARLFEKEIHKSFDGYLQKYGFSCTKREIVDNEFSVVYRKKEQYILIGCMLKPEHYPFYFYISLGEGGNEMPEANWNAVALWQVMQSVAPDDYEKYLPIFNVHAGIKESEIADKIWTACELCKECAWEFFQGELDHFRALRKELNQAREPYKIYVLDSDGKYRLTIDQESLKYKKMFS